MNHSSSEAHHVAEQNVILRCQVGSGVHGVTVDGQDDRDEMGICIEPADYVIGLKRFEQYQYRTQPEGRRSGPGDLDLVVYGLRKWARLAAAGNPTVLIPLFVPSAEVVDIAWPGLALRKRPHLFLSRDCGRRFIGYLDSQRDQMLGLRGKHTNRPELIALYGFDVKFAYHAVRLGIQGVELLTTGWITLPIPEPERSWLLDLRHGKIRLSEVLDRIADLRDQLVGHTEVSWLPDHAPQPALDRWLVDVYRDWWEQPTNMRMPLPFRQDAQLAR